MFSTFSNLERKAKQEDGFLDSFIKHLTKVYIVITSATLQTLQ
jgi:hypothetical protein